MTQASSNRISNTIRTLRFMRNEMTQQDLADRIGVTRQTVVAIEQGRYAPSLEIAFRIAEVFGVKMEEVFQYRSEAEVAKDEPKKGKK